MSDKESFGLRMRAARERLGVTLETIADRTKVSVTLWQALERNDFSKWPSGLFARSYVRDYAAFVGLNAEEVVDEFCRYFPQGDRRRGNLVRAHAEVMDVVSEYRDDQLPPEGDRRATAAPFPARWTFPGGVRGQRGAGVTADALVVGIATAGIAQMLPVGYLNILGVVAILYYATTNVLLGQTPGLALAGIVARRGPQLAAVPDRSIHATR